MFDKHIDGPEFIGDYLKKNKVAILLCKYKFNYDVWIYLRIHTLIL